MTTREEARVPALGAEWFLHAGLSRCWALGGCARPEGHPGEHVAIDGTFLPRPEVSP